MKNKAILIHSQDGDWEGLFINGKLIGEGHQLGEGRKEYFWLNIGAKYGITGDDLIIKEIEDIDEDYLSTSGKFPATLAEMRGKYAEPVQADDYCETCGKFRNHAPFCSAGYGAIHTA